MNATRLKAYRGILIVMALASAQAAEGQCLTPGFPTTELRPLTTHAPFSGSVGLRYQPPECRGRPVFRIAEGALIGAASGWLTYELAVGIWVSGEGATPDASMRRLRTTLVLGGATLGALRAVYIWRRCHSQLGGRLTRA